LLEFLPIRLRIRITLANRLDQAGVVCTKHFDDGISGT
jgi:hypothetical protein